MNVCRWDVTKMLDVVEFPLENVSETIESHDVCIDSWPLPVATDFWLSNECCEYMKQLYCLASLLHDIFDVLLVQFGECGCCFSNVPTDYRVHIKFPYWLIPVETQDPPPPTKFNRSQSVLDQFHAPSVSQKVVVSCKTA